MAKMYPEWLNADEVDSPYEPKLFELFQKHLSDEYTIFYSVRLQKPRPRHKGGVEDLEVDFVIAHPQYGLLCLESKGGNIAIDAKSGTWRNQDTGKTVNNPFKQSHGSCYALMEWLRSRPETASVRYPVWWAVALPSINVNANEEIEPGQPRAVVLDKTDLLPANIAASMLRVFRHYERKDGASHPGAKGIKALEWAMAKSWFLRAYMAADFEHEEEQIKQLTNAQFKILRQMDSNLRMIITGVAGSGKTMLAMEKAHRLAQDGLRVLFVCYNINLATQIRQHLPASDTLTVTHFHQFAADYITRAGLTAPASQGADSKTLPDFYDTRLPNALLDAIGQSEEYYDAIVVDEGQDFKTTYWTPLQLLLANLDGGILYIFCDDSQRIYSRDALPFLQPRYHLDQNLRNTREIGNAVGDYHCSPDYYEAAGPESKRPPQVVNTSKYNDKSAALADVLEDLKSEKVPAEHIVVLTPLGEYRSHWKAGLKVGSFTLARGVQNQKPGQIAVETIQAFKGLERPVAILTELNRWLPDERDELLYIALSRARNHIIVFDDLPAPVKNGQQPTS